MNWRPPGFGGRYLDDVVMPDFPAQAINRNAPCWCRSGLKYKKCHRDRAEEASPALHELDELGRRAFMTGSCLHPEANDATCRGKGVIRSHSIQRGGGLSAIAEAGHVLTSKSSSLQETERRKGKPALSRIGLNRASTFPGFCSFHDAQLFRPIERGDIEVNPHTAFLFGYRAFCLELQRKRASLEFHRSMRHRLDAGRNLLDQYAIQCDLLAGRFGVEVGLRDLEKARPIWDRTLLSNDFSSVHFVALWLDELLPVAASTAHLPATDFAGAKIQD